MYAITQIHVSGIMRNYIDYSYEGIEMNNINKSEIKRLIFLEILLRYYKV